jgi:hypothetical protein
MKHVVTVEESQAGVFEDVCSDLIDKGYKMVSSSCGFLNSEEYLFCSFYMAIMVKETEA